MICLTLRAHHARDKATDASGGCISGRRERSQPGCRQTAACCRVTMVDATLSEHGAVEGGTSCRGMNRLALVHQGDIRHPRLRHRRSPDLRASDGGSGGWLQKSTRTARSITRRGSLAIEDTDPEKKRKTLDTTPVSLLRELRAVILADARPAGGRALCGPPAFLS
jgi:hypothetical protein